MKTNPEHTQKMLDKILQELENEPWYKKLMRWIRLKYWMIYCKITNDK